MRDLVVKSEALLCKIGWRYTPLPGGFSLAGVLGISGFIDTTIDHLCLADISSVCTHQILYSLHPSKPYEIPTPVLDSPHPSTP